MRNIILILITSLSFAAQAEPFFPLGTYESADGECRIHISVSDFFRTGREQLVIEMEETSITPWGANLTKNVREAENQFASESLVEVDNAAGFGAFVAGYFYKQANGYYKFQAVKMSPDWEPITETIVCEDMMLKP